MANSFWNYLAKKRLARQSPGFNTNSKTHTHTWGGGEEILAVLPILRQHFCIPESFLPPDCLPDVWPSFPGILHANKRHHGELWGLKSTNLWGLNWVNWTSLQLICGLKNPVVQGLPQHFLCLSWRIRLPLLGNLISADFVVFQAVLRHNYKSHYCNFGIT